MSISQTTLVQRCRYLLGDNPWETTGSASNATSVVSVEDADEWAKGAVGEFDDGDAFLVREAEGYDLNALRSYNGSTGAAHAASSRIVKDPKYQYGEITNAISATIKGFLPWPRIYKVVADTITPDAANVKWYDLAATAEALVSVYQLNDTAPLSRRHYGRFHRFERVLFERNLPTSLCASGVGVSFPDGFLE